MRAPSRRGPRGRCARARPGDARPRPVRAASFPGRRRPDPARRVDHQRFETGWQVTGGVGSKLVHETLVVRFDYDYSPERLVGDAVSAGLVNGEHQIHSLEADLEWTVTPRGPAFVHLLAGPGVYLQKTAITNLRDYTPGPPICDPWLQVCRPGPVPPRRSSAPAARPTPASTSASGSTSRSAAGSRGSSRSGGASCGATPTGFPEAAKKGDQQLLPFHVRRSILKARGSRHGPQDRAGFERSGEVPGLSRDVASGELRFGESLKNPFADGEMTHWYHLDCAAFKRPEPFLETLDARSEEPLPDQERLLVEARQGLARRRLPRVDGASRAPTGRAQCRSCRAPIDKGAWRIALVFYEEGLFQPSGFVHAGCAQAYFETIDIPPRVRRFSPELREEALAELATASSSRPRPERGARHRDRGRARRHLRDGLRYGAARRIASPSGDPARVSPGAHTGHPRAVRRVRRGRWLAGAALGGDPLRDKKRQEFDQDPYLHDL